MIINNLINQQLKLLKDNQREDIEQRDLYYKLFSELSAKISQRDTLISLILNSDEYKHINKEEI